MTAAVAEVCAAPTAAAAERALGWLAAAWEDRDADDACLAVEALALTSICRLLSGSPRGAADAVELAIASAVPEPAWAGADLLCGLLSAAAALREGSGLAAGARQYLRALRGLDPAGAVGANAVLLQLALHGRASTCGAGPGGMHRLRGSAGEVRQFVAEVEACTAFGTTPVALGEPAATLLEGAAVAAFRSYDLPFGMRLLRAAGYLSDRHRPAGLHFVRCSQCDDGSFGDYDTALARMKARGDGDARLRLKLPVTLQALWTLAELQDPRFRLARFGFADPFRELV